MFHWCFFWKEWAQQEWWIVFHSLTRPFILVGELQGDPCKGGGIGVGKEARICGFRSSWSLVITLVWLMPYRLGDIFSRRCHHYVECMRRVIRWHSGDFMVGIWLQHTDIEASKVIESLMTSVWSLYLPVSYMFGMAWKCLVYIKWSVTSSFPQT